MCVVGRWRVRGRHRPDRSRRGCNNRLAFSECDGEPLRAFMQDVPESDITPIKDYGCCVENRPEKAKVDSDKLTNSSLWSVHSPSQNTGVGSLSLLQRIFLTQGSNSGLPHCRQILYQQSHKGNPRILKWVPYPFSRGSSQPRNGTGVSCIASGFFTNWVHGILIVNLFPSLLWP